MIEQRGKAVKMLKNYNKQTIIKYHKSRILYKPVAYCQFTMTCMHTVCSYDTPQ